MKKNEANHAGAQAAAADRDLAIHWDRQIEILDSESERLASEALKWGQSSQNNNKLVTGFGSLSLAVMPRPSRVRYAVAIGHPGSVNRMLSTGRLDRNLASEQNALTKVLFPDEISTQKSDQCQEARTDPIYP